MPKDEWEPEGTDGVKPADEAVVPAISAADQEILDAVKATGLSASELAARARRDIERERAEPAGTAPAVPAGADGEADDELLTRAEGRKLAEQQAQQFAGLVRQEMARGRIGDVIDQAAEQAFGMALPDEEMQIVRDKVADAFRKNVSLAGKERSEFEREVRRLTATAVKERRDWFAKAGGKSPTETKQEMDRRMEAQRGAPVSGKPGGSGKSSAPAVKVASTPGAALVGARDFDRDNPQYGIGIRQPSDAELNAQFHADMDAHNEADRAGR